MLAVLTNGCVLQDSPQVWRRRLSSISHQTMARFVNVNHCQLSLSSSLSTILTNFNDFKTIDQNNFVHQHIATNDNLFQKVFLTQSMFRCDPLSWWWASPPASRRVTGWSRYWPFEFYETWNKIVFSFKYLSNEAAAQARQLLDNRDLDGFCLQVQLGNASGDNI